ncbi:MAG TPA: FtsW/RodA/SpoVE family cell cycle protein [Phycisphaerae bacterium]|nr:FtsW/RodA/SpoVE family cell cycle protein [Phycisphaerae bacterium]HRW53876.1 FtsW/RodA/SpoVE family cell cycle protein [Phycisphaerae bacterium]
MREWMRAIPPLGWPVLLAALTLTLLGLLGIYSAEAGLEGPPRVTMRQFMFLSIGLGGFFAVQVIGYRELGRWSYILFFVTLAALGALLVARYVPMSPVIVARRNAYRWITIGPMTFQVSEYAKVSFILALAYYLRYRTNYRSIGGLLMPFILTLVPLGMILKEPDLGTSLLLLPTLFVMLYVAGAKNRHLIVILTLGAIAVPVFYFSPLMNPYQRQRIQSLFHQDQTDTNWRLNAGYQLNQSKIAIGSGGVAGQGFQQSAFFRHNLLPEEHNDFIFAVVAHQWGFLGALFVVTLYLAIIATGLTIASATNDPLGRLLAVGVCAVICSQTIINIGMTIGLMPITGMSLPFVSAGGSGLISNYLALGLLVSVARRRPVDMAPKPFEFDDA